MNATVKIGQTQSVSARGFTAAEVGTPLVELTAPDGEIISLKPDQAERIAAALIEAATKARGMTINQRTDATHEPGPSQ